MFFDPLSLLMLSVLVAVTGYVIKSVIVAFRRGGGDSKPVSTRVAEMEERLRKIEVATSSLLVDMTSMREKQRFMARLGESAASREAQTPHPQADENGLSPLATQSVPMMSRPRGAS